MTIAVAIVYLAKNRITGKCYVGVTGRGLTVRKRHHERDAARHVDSSPWFHAAIRKYGPAAFDWTIIATFSSIELALIGEAKAIEERRPEYNILAGGLGASGRKWTDEQRACHSAQRKGIVFSDEHRRNLSLAHVGKKQSAETIEKRLQHRRGKPLSAEHRAKISATLSGHPGFKRGSQWRASNVAM